MSDVFPMETLGDYEYKMHSRDLAKAITNVLCIDGEYIIQPPPKKIVYRISEMTERTLTMEEDDTLDACIGAGICDIYQLRLFLREFICLGYIPPGRYWIDFQDTPFCLNHFWIPYS